MNSVGVFFTPLWAPLWESLLMRRLADAAAVPLVRAAVLEFVEVHSQSDCEMGQIQLRQFLLACEQRLVHFPEFVLIAGGLGGFGGGAGVGVDGIPREMTKHESQAIAQTLLHLPDHGDEVETVGAFVIAVFDDRDGSVRPSLCVILVGDRLAQPMVILLWCFVHRLLG
jgi:hypothetical protein